MGDKDPRDVDSEPWKWRRYRQNRLALKGFEAALKLVKEEIERPSAHWDRELMGYRIVDRLCREGGLDVVTLGMDAEAAENREEKDRRKRKGHGSPDAER